jgi:hypothetical protein
MFQLDAANLPDDANSNAITSTCLNLSHLGLLFSSYPLNPNPASKHDPFHSIIIVLPFIYLIFSFNNYYFTFYLKIKILNLEQYAKLNNIST